MFSRAVFWQSIRSHYVLWVICTVVLTVMLSLIIAFHDPSRLSAFMEAIQDTPMAAEAGDQLDLFASLLGILTQTVYGFSGLMIAMVYVVVTANGLVASEVDRGSMAYTLSTPIKRTTVIFTKALYLIVSILVMCLIVGGAGALTTQLKHHALWGTEYTADVKAAAQVLELDNAEVAGNLSLIVNNPQAFAAGAAARGLNSDVYAAYLTQALQRDAYAAAPEAQQAVVQEQLAKGVSAAAEHLGMTTAELGADLSLLRSDSAAMDVASQASGLDRAILDQVLIQAIAANEVSADIGVDFDGTAYLVMNVGFLLLMLAIGGISFLASCIFNLSKFSLALGAGLPFAFLILNLLSTVNDTLEPLRYFSLITLFDTENILQEGTYWPQFVALALVAAVLYALALRIFKRKDLPL